MKLSDAKVGDKVLMEFTVTGIYSYAIDLKQENYDYNMSCLADRPVISIIHPEIEPKIGMIVSYMDKREYEIIYIHGDNAWIRPLVGSHQTIQPLKDIKQWIKDRGVK